uniref:Solute carrier family 35 member F2 n=1 Tax=Cyprinus carpio TaxID=7962 RepID=A0A8C2BBK0_CYPCA
MDCEVGENSFEHGRLGALRRWGRFLCDSRALKFKDVFTWQLCKTIAMGQALSMLICGTAVTCQYLADAGVETPMLQSFLNYTLLLLTYTFVLAFRRGENNIFQILKTKWWKYFLMALTDVEANYTIVKAYQFTTLTSIQLLDCFVIPVLMVLSWIFLKTRYRPLHFIAVAVCMLGVGAMVGADLLAGRDQGSSSHVLLGDGLVLVSAALYAVSNVCQEYTVKNLSRVEFLVLCPPSHFLSLLFVAYTLCMYGLYSFMPVVVNMSSATAVNLSLLTADLFSLFCGMFLFHYNFSGLYIVSFVVITLGFIMFNIVPTYTADQSNATNDRVYHLASSADVQQDGDIVVDWLQKEGQENEDRIGSRHRAHCNGFCSQI